MWNNKKKEAMEQAEQLIKLARHKILTGYEGEVIDTGWGWGVVGLAAIGIAATDNLEWDLHEGKAVLLTASHDPLLEFDYSEGKMTIPGTRIKKIDVDFADALCMAEQVLSDRLDGNGFIYEENYVPPTKNDFDDCDC